MNCQPDVEDHAVRGDQHGEPRQAEQPCEDDVGQPVVAEEDAAESIAAAQVTATTTHRAMPRRLVSRLATR